MKAKNLFLFLLCSMPRFFQLLLIIFCRIFSSLSLKMMIWIRRREMKYKDTSYDKVSFLSPWLEEEFIFITVRNENWNIFLFLKSILESSRGKSSSTNLLPSTNCFLSTSFNAPNHLIILMGTESTSERLQDAETCWVVNKSNAVTYKSS